tara:strand:+ start:17141 stop:17392 length:252 start_codon:yes stop_codon:yes gene_type:complete
MEINNPEFFLTRFLNDRGLDKPSARPLFSYHLTFDEFTELKDIVRKYRPKSKSSLVNKSARSWSACFVLWASEWYRCKYQAKK